MQLLQKFENQKLVKTMYYFIFGKKHNSEMDDKRAKNILDNLDDSQMVDILGQDLPPSQENPQI